MAGPLRIALNMHRAVRIPGFGQLVPEQRSELAQRASALALDRARRTTQGDRRLVHAQDLPVAQHHYCPPPWRQSGQCIEHDHPHFKH